jgi:iron complex transport system ATP-binding protein
MGAPLLELTGVRVGPAARPRLVVDRFALAAGERVAVLGANGAGKTTLLRVLGGWTVPEAGQVLLEGQPLAATPRRLAARRIAAVLAEEEAPFAVRVRDVVALGRFPWRSRLGAPRPQDLAAIDRALAAADLGALADRNVATLSSGERQRVALARALAQEPAVLLVDEATAHLDLGRREQLAALLAAEADGAGRAVVAVLHDLDLAAAWAHRVLVLAAGRVAAEGDVAAVVRAACLGPLLGVPLAEVVVPGRATPLVVVDRTAPA